jgi:hypothetical protein
LALPIKGRRLECGDAKQKTIDQSVGSARVSIIFTSFALPLFAIALSSSDAKSRPDIEAVAMAPKLRVFVL